MLAQSHDWMVGWKCSALILKSWFLVGKQKVNVYCGTSFWHWRMETVFPGLVFCPLSNLLSVP